MAGGGGQARGGARRAARWRTVAACSHGDVVGGVLFELADRGVAIGPTPRMQKGSVWVLEVGDAEVRVGPVPAPAGLTPTAGHAAAAAAQGNWSWYQAAPPSTVRHMLIGGPSSATATSRR